MASLFKLLISPVLLIIGRKKLDVRMYPFLVGAGVYFVISILRALIRSGFSAYDAGTAFFSPGADILCSRGNRQSHCFCLYSERLPKKFGCDRSWHRAWYA